MKGTKTIFDCNYMDKNIDKNQMDEIKSLCRFVIKKFWLYRRAYKKTIERIVQFIISMSCCITIAGGVTLNPIELGTMFGAGVLLKTFSEYKIIRKKSSSGYWYILVF